MTLQEIFDSVHKTGGATYRPFSRQTPRGYMVSRKGTEEKYRGFNVHHLLRYEADHRTMLTCSPDLYVGIWVDNGTTYLDLSVAIPDRHVAIAFAKAQGQLAIYDIANNETIRV